MPKPVNFSLAYLAEILSSPQIKTIAARMHPTAVRSVVKGVFDDLSQEFWSSVNEQRLPDVNELIERVVDRLSAVLEISEPLTLDARGRIFPDARERLAEPAYEDAAWLLAEPQTDYSRRQDLARERSTVSKLARMTGAESVAIFSSTRTARAAILQLMVQNNRQVVVARRDLYEREDGERLEDSFDLFPNLKRREVGACNSIRYDDYLRACNDQTGLVWRALGRWTLEGRSVAVNDLVKLKNVSSPSCFILGEFEFAPLVDLTSFFTAPIPTVAERLKSGYDLVLVDGAQLIGGPNCGLLFGARALVGQITDMPAAQLTKLHRIPGAALAKTVALYDEPERALETIPALRIVSTPLANLQSRAERLAALLNSSALAKSARAVEGYSPLCANPPLSASPTRIIELIPRGYSSAELAAKLEKSSPRLLVRWTQDAILIDLKTLAPEHDLVLLELFDKIASAPNALSDE